MVPDGYVESVEGYNITNTYIGNLDVSGQKTWNDGNNADGKRPTEITVKLYQKIKGSDEEAAEIASKTITVHDNWKYSFTDLPKYDANGAEYEYTVKEEPVAGYSSKVEGYDVTNTQLRPTEITVKLLQNGDEIDQKTVSAANQWKYSFTDLPKYDANGAKYEYTVKEEAVAGYSSKVEGYDVTNTQLTEVNGEKIWNDKDNADQVRPAEITIKLLQNGAEYDQKTVNATEQWKYSFTDLPKYD